MKKEKLEQSIPDAEFQILQAMILKLSRERLTQRLPLEEKNKALYRKFKQRSFNHNRA